MAAWLNFFPATYHGYTSTLVQQAIVALIWCRCWRRSGRCTTACVITVREALSDYGIGGNPKPKTRRASRSALLIPRPIRLSLRNTFRRRLRLALTLFTLVLAGAIFISVYNLWASFDKVINDIQGYFLADINISFDRAYRFDKVAALARSVPGVEERRRLAGVPRNTGHRRRGDRPADRVRRAALHLHADRSHNHAGQLADHRGRERDRHRQPSVEHVPRPQDRRFVDDQDRWQGNDMAHRRLLHHHGQYRRAAALRQLRIHQPADRSPGAGVFAAGHHERSLTHHAESGQRPAGDLVRGTRHPGQQHASWLRSSASSRPRRPISSSTSC